MIKKIIFEDSHKPISPLHEEQKTLEIIQILEDYENYESREYLKGEVDNLENRVYDLENERDELEEKLELLDKTDLEQTLKQLEATQRRVDQVLSHIRKSKSKLANEIKDILLKG